MEARFELAFTKALSRHGSIKKQVEKKVRMIMEHPLAMGETLKANLRGFYSCPVKRSFLIVFLYCSACRKKGNDEIVACSDCDGCPDDLVKFVLLAPHDETYNI